MLYIILMGVFIFYIFLVNSIIPIDYSVLLEKILTSVTVLLLTQFILSLILFYNDSLF